MRGTLAVETYNQWREGDSFAFTFPSAPKGRLLILFMGHRDEAREARKDPEGYWQRKLAEHPGVARRVAGLDPRSYTKLRSTGDTPAFFRASSGPGWALAGDAGHFKDPVTGQGMRDAMWMGRTLAERILPSLEGPTGVDWATRAWEADRDRDCLPAYHFANLDTRVERQSPVLCELVRDAGRTNYSDLTDLFGRARTPQQIAPLPRLARALLAALWRGERPRGETLGRARGAADRARDPPRAPRRPLPGDADRDGLGPPGGRMAPATCPRQAAGYHRSVRRPRGDRRMTRIAVIQPALALGEVESNLARIEDLIRDAQREHHTGVVLVPEGCTSPNVYARVLLGTARPVDGQPFQLLTRLARELE